MHSVALRLGLSLTSVWGFVPPSPDVVLIPRSSRPLDTWQVVSPDKVIRVVLVDDSLEFLRAAGGFCRALPGVEVVGTAASGPDAIQVVQTVRPDVVLLDYEMPGMTGLEAARAIKAIDASVRVVIVSLRDEVRHRVVASMDVDAFISKASFTDTCPIVIADQFAARARASVVTEEGLQ